MDKALDLVATIRLVNPFQKSLNETMKTGTILYIRHNDRILLINWKKYGYWCGVGGFVGQNGDTIQEVGITAAQNLCGIKATITNLRGRLIFDCRVCEECSTVYHVFDAHTDNPFLTLSPSLHNAKWVQQDKALNYKLFPNSDRFLLNTYLHSERFFDLKLEYTKEGINKTDLTTHAKY